MCDSTTDQYRCYLNIMISDYSTKQAQCFIWQAPEFLVIERTVVLEMNLTWNANGKNTDSVQVVQFALQLLIPNNCYHFT